MRFEDLEVWKRAARLSADIYKALSRLKDYVFKDQDGPTEEREIIETKQVSAESRFTIRALKEEVDQLDKEIADLKERKTKIEAQIADAKEALGIS